MQTLADANEAVSVFRPERVPGYLNNISHGVLMAKHPALPFFSVRFAAILLISLALFAAERSDASVGDWKTFTSSRDVRQIVCRDSVVWGATSGGVIRYSVRTGALICYTNSEGLSSNDVVAVALDQQSRVWAALSNGDMNIFSPSEQTWLLKTEYHGYQIQNLYPYGDSIFVSMNIGVSLYNSRRWEVKETYKIGDVRSVQIIQRTLWAACKDGLRYASIDFPNLIAPSAWTHVTTVQGLENNETFCVHEFNNLIFVATKTGLSVFDGSHWRPTELDGFSISDLKFSENRLLAVTGDGIWVRDVNAGWSRLADWINTAESAAVDLDGVIWLAVRNTGLGFYKSGNAHWSYIEPKGPADNKFSALVFDQTGNLWTASSTGGISRFDGKTWRTFSMENAKLPSNDFRTLAVDNQNRVWAGSWGGGVAVFTTSGDTISVSFINSINKKLSGIQQDANYVVVTGIEKDAAGHLWLLNYYAADQRALAVTDSMGNWQYFSTVDGLRSTLTTAFTVDGDGRKWIGTEKNGISVLDDNNTPFTKSDDDLRQGLGTEDGLVSAHITSLAADATGQVWIGTPLGLQYWYGGKVKNSNFSVINDDVNCVRVDVRDNIWVGTVGGVSVQESVNYTTRHYTTTNSPLVSEFVTCFAFDEKYGYVFIGTTNGLSRLETPYTRPAADLAQVHGYPNPFILTASAWFYIENLADHSSLRIFTPEGLLVRHIPQNKILGSRVAWDGRNDHGEYVASGVYIFLITTEDGLSKTGKIAVLRP